MAASVLTPLQLDVGPGLLQNQGLAPNSEFVLAVDAYQGTALISPFLQTIANGAVGNILSNATIGNLNTLASSTCPALADSVPSGYATLIVTTTTPGLSGLLSSTANTYLGNGDLTKFAQALAIADGYAQQTNLFVTSAVNSQTYLGNTFTNMNDMITGDITTVNLATQAMGQDLVNLGNLINLDNLNNLGSPLALVQQIVSITGNSPVLAAYFIAEGIPQEIVLNLTNPATSVVDSIQKLMYQAMTKIVNDDLNQILTVLKVTTTGIETMADLLNPLKLFPNSFQSLTVPTANGLRAIYTNNTGSVNTSLATELPPYVVSSVA